MQQNGKKHVSIEAKHKISESRTGRKRIVIDGKIHYVKHEEVQ
jgi:hypothetical protein